MRQQEKKQSPLGAAGFDEVAIQKIRNDFPILATQVYGKPLVYFDNAATSLKPRQVVQALDDYYLRQTANVHRGIHFLSEAATTAFENVRTQVAEWIRAHDSSEIIFTRGTTESINLVAQSYGRHFLKAGDEILITEMEHHANIVPWQMLCEEKGLVLRVAPVTDSGEIDLPKFYDLLSPKTKIAAFTFISNTLGTINPVKELIQKAKAVGAVVLLDAAQAVGHLPVDVTDLQCDFLAFSAHKMLGPTGIGVLYGRNELLQKMPPVQGGGSMIDEVTLAKTTYNVSPHKFEAGTPHIAGVLGLGAAIDYLQNLGVANIHARDVFLTNYFSQQLKTVAGLRRIGAAQNHAAIFSFVCDGAHPHDLATLLDREGIAIRTGHHCTQPLLARLGVTATARASLSFYNTTAEIDRFFVSLAKVKGLF